MIMQNKRLIGIVTTIAHLLCLPLIAMQLTEDFNWTLFDFIVAGALLLATGLMFELVLRRVKKIAYRIAICSVILAALLIIWAELAVGMFGTQLGGT